MYHTLYSPRFYRSAHLVITLTMFFTMFYNVFKQVKKYRSACLDVSISKNRQPLMRLRLQRKLWNSQKYMNVKSLYNCCQNWWKEEETRTVFYKCFFLHSQDVHTLSSISSFTLFPAGAFSLPCNFLYFNHSTIFKAVGSVFFPKYSISVNLHLH